MFLIGLGFMILQPMIMRVVVSFMAESDLYDSSITLLPRHLTLENYEVCMSPVIMNYWEALFNSTWISFTLAILQVAACAFVGYGFARFNFRGKSVLFAILIFTIIVPIQTYMIPLYVGFRNFDFFGIGSLVNLFTGMPMTVSLLNTNIPFYLMAGLGAGIRSGLYIFMLRQFFVGMPRELDEAASIDGCGPLQVFTKVMIPNAVPMMVTIVVFSLVWYWNDYYLSSMFFDELPPLSQKLAEVADAASLMAGLPSSVSVEEFSVIKEGVLACGCLLTILPPLVLYIFAQRYFTEGLERSGIVG